MKILIFLYVALDDRLGSLWRQLSDFASKTISNCGCLNIRQL